MPFEMVFAVAGLILGVALLVYSSNKAIEHTIQIALEWGITPFVVGLILVSIGLIFLRSSTLSSLPRWVTQTSVWETPLAQSLHK